MRKQLLNVAITQFGTHGFAGTATRSIAKEAGTAMSSITYYFGGKEGLYLACAEYIAASVNTRLDSTLASIETTPPNTRAAALNTLCSLVTEIAHIMLDGLPEHWSYFIAREQQFPTMAFERLWHGAMQRIISVVIELIRHARTDFSDDDARYCAFSLWGQAITLRTTRAIACRTMQVDQLEQPITAVLLARFIDNTRCMIASGSPTDNLK